LRFAIRMITTHRWFSLAIIVTLAWVFLGQRLEPIQFVGAGLIMVSVVVAQTAPRPIGAPAPAMPLDAESPTEDASQSPAIRT